MLSPGQLRCCALVCTLGVTSLQSRTVAHQNVPAAPRAALFPASNALTRVDEEYFAMIRAEAEWGDNSNNNNNNNTATAEDEEPWLSRILNREVKVDSHGFPDSYSLTETDRQYFNIIKTEDGSSDFFTDPPPPPAPAPHIPAHRAPAFQYHIVRTNTSRPIVGIYLPDQARN